MSRPPLNPEQTAAGIALDPQTLERVIPESRRPDGSLRPQKKIRPGFTPQEDVRRFRSSRQVEMEAAALPKGHIVGWTPPQAVAGQSSGASKPLSKSAKKNAKRKEKREEKKDVVPDNWDDDEGDEATSTTASTPTTQSTSKETKPTPVEETAAQTDAQSSSTTSNSLETQLESLKLS